MALPDLVIGGAPKCGTTSLFHWLADHPDVCPSATKETFFLVDADCPFRDPHHNYQDHGLEGYERYFRHCGRGARRTLEATTHYLYQRTARDVLAALETRPDVVFMLREPASRVYSSFQYSRRMLATLDPSLTFSDFVGLAIRRPEKIDALVSKPRSAYVLRNDIRFSRYVEFVPRWIESLGRDRVHLLLFEDLRRDPRSFVQDLARKLGLAPEFYEPYSFRAENPTIPMRSRALHKMVRAVRPLVPKTAGTRNLYRAYLGLQQRPAEGPDGGDRQALRELREHFRPYNERLSRETGLDLAAWSGEASDGEVEGSSRAISSDAG